MADNLFEAKVDLELPVQVFADAYGNISRGLKRIYTKENGDVVFVLTDGTEHIVGNVVGQQGPTGPASTIPGPTGPTGATGSKGDPGKDGENGAPGIYYGSTQPSGPDFPVWIDPSGAAGIPLSITGPTGATGSPGVKGDTGSPGAKGDKGEPGAKGDKGDKGDTGVTPNLTIGTVTTLEAGQDATASMGGTTANPVLNLGIPRGAKGEPGEGGGGIYYVELEGEFPGYTLSETTPLANIVAAYNDGKALFCRGNFNGEFTIELPLLSAVSSGSIFIFSGSHCVDNTGVLPENAMITIAVAESGVYCEYQEYLTKADIVTSVSSSSTDDEVPSAKCLYDLVGNIADRINAL